MMTPLVVGAVACAASWVTYLASVEPGWLAVVTSALLLGQLLLVWDMRRARGLSGGPP